MGIGCKDIRGTAYYIPNGIRNKTDTGWHDDTTIPGEVHLVITNNLFKICAQDAMAPFL